MNNKKKTKLTNEEFDAFNYMFNREVSVRENPNHVEKCHVCGKTLTKEDSIKHKMGAKCRENRLNTLLVNKMREFDKELITDNRELENEIQWLEAIDESIIKKVSFLLDLVNHFNSEFNKTRDNNTKKTKKVVLNFASMILNNLWDLDTEDEDLWSNRNLLILARSVQFQDKEILKFTVPNTNF